MKGGLHRSLLVGVLTQPCVSVPLMPQLEAGTCVPSERVHVFVRVWLLFEQELQAPMLAV